MFLEKTTRTFRFGGACAPRRTFPMRAAPGPASPTFSAMPGGAELQSLANEPGVRALLLALADHSPFLWQLATANASRLKRCLETAPAACLETCLAALEEACGQASSEAAIMRALRLAKQETALLVALADLGGVFDVIAATEALSRAADVFISVALRFLLRDAARADRLRLSDGANPEQGCGLVILALGKLGARELNYSSDVDIVVFFDPNCAAIAGAVEPATLFARITKGLVRLLQERTGDGYVLRVDLRLRPDPGSTAVAIALPAAYSYYESLGQNWERAALIKARPAAGDKALGEAFLANLMPFIWRKYFDYAAIADIAAMKRQIHAVRGHAEIAVAGHDVKLGRGGIREIEFFVQTQQLIFGGKRPRLRGARTLDMLDELGKEGWVTREAVADLRASYLFLREIEHRLQMVADEQTQRLPQDEEILGRFARFCGYTRKSRFCGDVTHRLRLVSHHYGRLFEHSPRLDAAAGSLVFTGADDDPETLETLLRLGFKQAPLAAETIRGWHFGRRSRRAHPSRAGSPHRIGAAAFAGVRALRRSRCRARRVRFRADRHARGSRTFFGAEIQSAGLRIVRRNSWRRAKTCAHRHKPSACARRRDRSGSPQGSPRRKCVQATRRTSPAT